MGSVGLAGGACAVGVPVAMSSSRGNHSSLNRIEVNYCDSASTDQLEKTSLGETDNKNVCWKYDAQAGGDSQVGDSKYTALFSELFNKVSDNETHNGILGASGGLKQCDGAVSPWGIVASDQENNTGYAGLCERSGEQNIKFIKQKPEKLNTGNTEKLEFGTCDSECWAEEESSNNMKVYKKEKTEKGKKVEFYKKGEAEKPI